MIFLRSHLAVSIAAAFFLAADKEGFGTAAPTVAPPEKNRRYRRKEDGEIVSAERFTDVKELTIGMLREPGRNKPAYVITKTGDRQTVNIGEYVITESDGEHFFAYPAEKFEQEYEAAPMDTSTVDDLPKGGDVPVSAAVPSTVPAVDAPLREDTSDAPLILSELSQNGTIAETTHSKSAQDDAAQEVNSKDQEIAELRAWNNVAAESNKSVDAYLRQLYPDLPEHYGMPVDCIRQTIEHLLSKVAEAADSEKSAEVNNLASPGIHSPSSPDAPTADEAAEALSLIVEHFPNLAGGITGPVKEAAFAQHITQESREKILAAISVVDRRFK